MKELFRVVEESYPTYDHKLARFLLATGLLCMSICVSSSSIVHGYCSTPCAIPRGMISSFQIITICKPLTMLILALAIAMIQQHGVHRTQFCRYYILVSPSTKRVRTFSQSSPSAGGQRTPTSGSGMMCPLIISLRSSYSSKQ